MASLLSQLTDINKSTFQNDEEGRLAMMKAAQALFDRLEKPYERIFRMIWTEPYLMVAVKTTCDLNLFAQLSKEAQTSTQLAKSCYGDPALVSRLLRLLAICHVVDEVDVDTYIENEFSAAMKNKDGIQSGIHHFYGIEVQGLKSLPGVLKSNGYQNPDDTENPPCTQFIDPGGFWDYFKEHPEAYTHFHNLLASTREAQLSWFQYYPISERLLAGYDPETPLLVDVGGSKGVDLKLFHGGLPAEHQNAKLVLEDLPGVIETARKEPLPSQIQFLPHSFLTPQPASIKGARAYFLHSVIHDWHDNKATEILSHLRDVMTPGYSRIILMEIVLAERTAEVAPVMAALDLAMMSHFAAQERTERQWKALAEKAGLTVKGIWGSKGNRQAIIELGFTESGQQR